MVTEKLRTINRKDVIVFALSAAVLLICLINPKSVVSGNRDLDPFTEIRFLLSETSNAKLLYLSSDDDFYEFSGTSKLRKRFDVDFAREGVSEVLSAASFGDWRFNKYLSSNEITHILVPWSSAEKNRVARKWGTQGSIAIKLGSPFFVRQAVTSGEHPVALYKVLQTGGNILQTSDYELKWDDSTREDFYSQIESVREVGFYSYEYLSNFRDGASVSWVMSDETGVTEKPAFEIQTSTNEISSFHVTLEFVAAYGSYAPDQVITVSSPNWTKSVKVSSNRPGRIAFDVTSGEQIKLNNVLPCRSANSFDPATSDIRRFCYGLSSITVRPAQAR